MNTVHKLSSGVLLNPLPVSEGASGDFEGSESGGAGTAQGVFFKTDRNHHYVSI